MQLLHHEAVWFDGRRWRRRAPFVQRGRAATQGAGTLGRAVPQPAARGQHAAPRGSGRCAPAARRPRAPVAVAHVHPARAGRQPETGTATAAPAATVADHHRPGGHRRRLGHRHHRHRGSGHRDGTVRSGPVAAATRVVRVQQLDRNRSSSTSRRPSPATTPEHACHSLAESGAFSVNINTICV